MKSNHIIVLCLTILVSACASVNRIKKDVSLHSPTIGAIGRVNTQVLTKQFEQVGSPHLWEAIELSIQSLPFDRSSYRNYTSIKERKGEMISVLYSDSIAAKPKLNIIRLADFVTLKQQLNDDGNRSVKEYLGADDKYTMISQITFVASPDIEQQIKAAESLFLVENQKKLRIEIRNGQDRKFLDFNQLDIFDYQTANFCWELNKMGRPQISVISMNEKGCPKGTEKDARKLDNEKSYLKIK